MVCVFGILERIIVWKCKTLAVSHKPLAVILIFIHNKVILSGRSAGSLRLAAYSLWPAANSRQPFPPALLLLQQIRSALAGSLQRLFQAPLFDVFKMPAHQHVRHFAASELGRTGINRRRQQVVLKGIEQGGSLVVQHARQQASDGIYQYGSGQFAPRQHIVADGNFEGDEFLADALVYAFIMTGDDEQVVVHREAVGQRLPQGFAVGRHVDDLVVAALGLKAFNGIGQRLGHHHHARAAAELIIVNLLVPPQSELAKVVYPHVKQPLVVCALEDGMPERTDQQFGQRRNDVYMQGGN